MGNFWAQVFCEPGIAQVGSAKMLRRVLFLSLACGHNGWWWGNSTGEGTPPDPYREWLTDNFPKGAAFYDSARDTLRTTSERMGSFAEQSSERGGFGYFVTDLLA